MSSRSKKSPPALPRNSAGRAERAVPKVSQLERPFATDILKRARKLADDYQIVLARENRRWYGRGLELPQVFGDGATPDACIADTRSALVTAVAFLLEEGQVPPTPAAARKRSQQVNIRLTAEEKAVLEATAHRHGFEGLSDFMRAAALESTR